PPISAAAKFYGCSIFKGIPFSPNTKIRVDNSRGYAFALATYQYLCPSDFFSSHASLRSVYSTSVS
ncbi:hypothetical protein KXW91_000464, partial [Aspergillus fumigatus]